MTKPDELSGSLRVDAAVVGGGAVGLAAALALARHGVETAILAPPGPPADGRTVALLKGSVDFLRAIGAWDHLAAEAAPLASLRIVDDTGSLFRPPPVRFDASEIGLEAFGWNVENAQLLAALRAVCERTPGLTVLERPADAFSTDAARATLTLHGGVRVEARLAVAADGAHSMVREAAGIPVRRWSYPQSALTTLLRHERPHEDISTEFHTREGPFTLVPLPGGRRSSLVWVARTDEAERLAALDDAALGRAIETRAHSMLGRVTVEGPRGIVPMRGASAGRLVARRVALAGEAAHVFPPIGAQGLNLGLRDAAVLCETIAAARERGDDPGWEAVLRGYEAARKPDVTTRAIAVDVMNRSLLSGLLPLDLARGAGLLALSIAGPLRRLVMREGLLPHIGTPRLMRG